MRCPHNSTSDASADQPLGVLAETFSSSSAVPFPLTLLPHVPIPSSADAKANKPLQCCCSPLLLLLLLLHVQPHAPLHLSSPAVERLLSAKAFLREKKSCNCSKRDSSKGWLEESEFLNQITFLCTLQRVRQEVEEIPRKTDQILSYAEDLTYAGLPSPAETGGLGSEAGCEEP